MPRNQCQPLVVTMIDLLQNELSFLPSILESQINLFFSHHFNNQVHLPLCWLSSSLFFQHFPSLMNFSREATNRKIFFISSISKVNRLTSNFGKLTGGLK